MNLQLMSLVEALGGACRGRLNHRPTHAPITMVASHAKAARKKT